ncbi:adenylyltransferase/cytidyltransferase family protein [Planctomycetales bacterium ZRK34]|nr:adenylyltransferase/cytidyltransferase family protein [Planctomycetales bacterium ZRK34]
MGLPDQKVHVFVSGCYDILHAGHVEFFSQARSLGDFLTVCFASRQVLWDHKQRESSLPDEHKKALLESMRMVDQVVIGTGTELGLDFKGEFLRLRPDILAVTTDDQYGPVKRQLCEQVGARYHILEKTPPKFEPISTSQIVRYIQAPKTAPLRVDFGGGWLDVPRFARPDGYIVNCAISPLVSLRQWSYERQSGLGGSGAWALLNGHHGVDSELELGVGWQDPAVVHETGLCVWRSGPRPTLDFKRHGDLLRGRMALLWTGKPHDTPSLADQSRNLDLVQQAGAMARQAVLDADVEQLGKAIDVSYQMQLDEGMDKLPDVDGMIGRKYCGSGWGGYAVYLFDSESARDQFVAGCDQARAIEPYTR